MVSEAPLGQLEVFVNVSNIRGKWQNVNFL